MNLKSMAAKDQQELISANNMLKRYPNPTNGQEITLALVPKVEKEFCDSFIHLHVFECVNNKKYPPWSEPQAQE